ncbi:MAG: Fpg/Nei family DNA glycosylase [Chloroflexi bacterium]|nr:MAG: Fpg/Nei family DNA glycosylase [Chloroflexota bacterium]TMG59108.1 MAG: Fpg/Nei family DNA glycosylase [Chloroflexota bacterium]
MPEGDTIWRTAATLRQGLEGKRVLAARPDALKRLAGTTITEVKPVGKHLLIRFDNGLAIHSHMRMQGSWHLYKRGERWRRPAWQIKALLETDDVVAVCFGAPVVDLVRDETTKVGHLGPDILSDDWTAREVVARARSFGATALGEVLLDQRVTAGIGNVYRCEALWHTRINPWTKTTDLDDAQLTALFETAHEAMRANLNGGFKRRFPGYGRGAVHGRGGRPCPRCGTRIRVRAQGEHARLTYWCPACQP